MHNVVPVSKKIATLDDLESILEVGNRVLSIFVRCISKKAYSKWSHMKESQGFTKDDEVALYLLSLYEQNDTDNRYGQ